jgi:hypothetical protein
MNTCFRFVAFFLIAAAGCGERDYIDVRKILKRTEAELTRSFGPPDDVLEKAENVDVLRWKNIDGDSTRVYVVLRDGIARYVTYTFWGMKPFDQKEALRRVGIPWPEAEPEHVWEDGSKRWQPFGEYEKLVLTHTNKAVSVGELLPYHGPAGEKPRR